MYMYVCMCTTCLVPTEVSREYWILWNWSCIGLWTIMGAGNWICIPYQSSKRFKPLSVSSLFNYNANSVFIRIYNLFTTEMKNQEHDIFLIFFFQQKCSSAGWMCCSVVERAYLAHPRSSVHHQHQQRNRIGWTKTDSGELGEPINDFVLII